MGVKERSKAIRAVHDTMDVLNGKWKISILTSLSFGQKRYSEILKEVEGISGRMLTRELKDMEMNLLVDRKVLNAQPVTVLYSLTKYSENLMPVICNLRDWGAAHRKVIIGKSRKKHPSQQ